MTSINKALNTSQILVSTMGQAGMTKQLSGMQIYIIRYCWRK